MGVSIRRIIKEVMSSMVSDYHLNTTTLKEDDVTSVVTLISKDNVTKDKLYLFVSFKHFKSVSEYSYSFLLVDNENKPLSEYMTERSEVSKYLPQEIMNKRQIFPLIMDMTRKLMDEQLPDNVYRKTVEPIDGDSLKRYEEITKIMVDDYGYELVEKKVDNWGYTTWYLSRIVFKDNNKDMNESYEIIHTYDFQEKMKMTNDKLLKLLPNDDTPIFF